MDSNQLSAVYVKESGSTQRAGRFDDDKVGNSRRKNDILRAKRDARIAEKEELAR